MQKIYQAVEVSKLSYRQPHNSYFFERCKQNLQKNDAPEFCPREQGVEGWRGQGEKWLENCRMEGIMNGIHTFAAA